MNEKAHTVTDIERLRDYGRSFDTMAEEHLRHHYEEIRAQGLKQAELANAFHGAADKIERLTTETKERHTQLMSLSAAYLRLRGLIPGAFKTPHAPSPEQVWDTTERALEASLASTQGAHPGDIVEIEVPARSSTSKDGLRYRGRLVSRET